MKKTCSILAFMLFTVSVYGQKKTARQAASSDPFVLGRIEQIRSEVLAENRVLNIYLPEGYNHEDSIRYPVIYLLDGSADEDFIHITGLVQYNSFEWVKRIPKSIVVGIATVDRRRDFTFPATVEQYKKMHPASGHSDRFIAFLEQELQPFINRKYKTNSCRTLIGQSLGGLLSTEVLLKKPSLFNRYIIVSPSLWWNNGSLLDQPSILFQKDFTQQTDIYIGVGKEGLAPSETPRVMEVDANLLADKIRHTQSSNVRVIFDYLPAENHATIMHQAVSNAFRMLYSSGKEME